MTDDEIKAAYRRACMKAHPDRGGSEAEFQAVRAEYERLMKRKCPDCGGKGFIRTTQGFFSTKMECKRCWSKT